MSEIFTLLCTGQSNMARVDQTISWTPAENLKVWDYEPTLASDGIGSRFIKPASDSVNYGTLYGNEIAKANANADIHVINISRGGTNLQQWHHDAETPNMWHAIVNNVSAALSTLENKANVDEILWWGHESDASVNADVSADKFSDDFQSIIGMIDDLDWAVGDTLPIRFHKIHPNCNGLSSQINFALENIVLSDPNRFSLIDTTHLNYSDNIHLNGEEKQDAAIHAFRTKRPGAIEDREINPNMIRNGDFKEHDKSISGMPYHWKLLSEMNNFKFNKDVGYLAPKSAIEQELIFSEISGEILTVSLETTFDPLTVSICNHSATLVGGIGRRQVSFRIPKQYLGDVSLRITNNNDSVVSLSKIKLEKGGAHTAFESPKISS